MLRINNVLPRSKANGPGNRYTIWVQGCSIRCEGCTNTHTWPFEGGRDLSTGEVIDFLSSDPSIDGITITGGEPFDQFEETYEFCSKLKYFTSIFITTGYTMKQIVNKDYFKIIDEIDILCSGPFKQGLECSGEWRGSSNQVLYFLSEMGRKQSTMPVIDSEIYIDENGDARETGFTVWKLDIKSTPCRTRNVFMPE